MGFTTMKNNQQSKAGELPIVKTCWECSREYKTSKKNQYRFLCNDCYKRYFIPLLKHYSNSYVEVNYDKLVVKMGLRGKPLTAKQFDCIIDGLSFGV